MLKYGRNSRRAPHRSLNDICRDLRCTEPEKPARSTRQALSSSLTYSTSHPALEGTSCGESMVNWCEYSIYNVIIILFLKSSFNEIVVSEGSVYVASSSSPVLRHECGKHERNSQPTVGYCQWVCFRLLVWCRSYSQNWINGCHDTSTKLSTKVMPLPFCPRW